MILYNPSYSGFPFVCLMILYRLSTWNSINQNRPDVTCEIFCFSSISKYFFHFCCYCWTKCLKHNIAFIRQWCHLIITVEWPFWHWRTKKIGSHCVIIMEQKQTFVSSILLLSVIFVLESSVVILLELNSEVKEGRRMKKILTKTYSLSLPPIK